MARLELRGYFVPVTATCAFHTHASNTSLRTQKSRMKVRVWVRIGLKSKYIYRRWGPKGGWFFAAFRNMHGVFFNTVGSSDDEGQKAFCHCTCCGTIGFKADQELRVGVSIFWHVQHELD